MKHRTKLRILSIFNTADRQLLKTSAELVDLRTLAHDGMQRLIDDMITTMWRADGVGLAATQIGRSLRLAIVVGQVNGRAEPFVLINPTVTVFGDEQNSGEEGCLSVPGVFGIVKRATRINLKAFDRYGQPWSLPAADMFARIIQHEIDHLNGTLFIDRTSDITKGREKLS